MKNLLEILNRKPKLYEQTEQNMWDDPHISKGMLEAHLNDSLDSATRNLNFVETSVNWISSMFPSHSYPHILDLGCGPGIYTEMFDQKGYQVSGIDISKRSIEYARTSAHTSGVEIDYVQGDYTNLNINEKYDIITLIYCDFGVLSTEVRWQLLCNIYDALLPNGVFIFDVFKPCKYKDIEENKTYEIQHHGFWTEQDGIVFQNFYRYEEDHTYLNQYVIVSKDNEIHRYNVWEHTFEMEELIELLTQVGFQNLKFYGDVAGAMHNEKDETLCVIARKGSS